MGIKTVDRIKAYLDANSISLNAFDKAIGASNGYFGKQVKKQASIGSDVLEKIICRYTDINPIWLLTGEGDMIRSAINTKGISTRTPNDNAALSTLSNPNNAYNDTPTNGKTDTPTDTPTDILSPTSSKNVNPTVNPTRNLGAPKVVTVSDSDKELISLVPVKAAAGYLNGYGDPVFVESLPTIQFPNFGAGSHRAFEIKGSSMNPTLHNKSIVIARWVESFDDIEEGARRIYIVVTKEYGIVAKRVLNRINERGVLVMVSDNNNKKDYGNYDVYPEDVKELWYVRANLSFEFPEPDHSLVNRVDDLESRLNTLYNLQLKIT